MPIYDMAFLTYMVNMMMQQKDVEIQEHLANANQAWEERRASLEAQKVVFNEDMRLQQQDMIAQRDEIRTQWEEIVTEQENFIQDIMQRLEV